MPFGYTCAPTALSRLYTTRDVHLSTHLAVNSCPCCNSSSLEPTGKVLTARLQSRVPQDAAGVRETPLASTTLRSSCVGSHCIVLAPRPSAHRTRRLQTHQTRRLAPALNAAPAILSNIISNSVGAHLHCVHCASLGVSHCATLCLVRCLSLCIPMCLSLCLASCFSLCLSLAFIHGAYLARCPP